MTSNTLLTDKTGKINWQEWVFPLILLMLVVVQFSEFLFDGNKMLVSLDQVKALGIRTPVHSTLVDEGKLAEWSPGILGGMPAGDALAGDYMYPPSMILSKLFPQYRVFGYAMILHVLMAGIFFYMMLRRGFNMPPLIALIGGAFYMFNPEFFSHLFPGHDGKMFVIAWLPFIVWRVKEVLDRPNILNSSLVALGIAMALLTSHIQMSYFTMWGLIAYWIFHIFYSLYKEIGLKHIFWLYPVSIVSILYVFHLSSNILIVSVILFTVFFIGTVIAYRINKSAFKKYFWYFVVLFTFISAVYLLGLTFPTIPRTVVYFAIFTISILFPPLAFTCYKQKSIKPLLPSAFFLSGLLMGLAIGSLQLFPAYMYIHDEWSVRGVAKTPEDMWAHATSWCIHWPEFFSLWIAKFGNWFDFYWSENALKLNSEYAGAMVVFGALLALVKKPKSYRLFWAIFGLLMVAFALTFHTPIYKIFYNYAPSVNKMRAASMIMHWFSFVAVLLTTLFLKDVYKEFWKDFSETKLKIWKVSLLSGVGAVTLLTLIFHNQEFVLQFMTNITGTLGESSENMDKTPIFSANFTENFLPALKQWWFFISASLVLLFFVINGSVKKEVFLITILLLGLYDIMSINQEFVNIKPNRIFKNPNPTFKTLITKQESVTKPKKGQKPAEPFRVFFVDKPYADAYRFTDEIAVKAQKETRKNFYYSRYNEMLTQQVDQLKMQKNSVGMPLSESEIISTLAPQFVGNNPQAISQMATMGTDGFIDYIASNIANQQSQVGKSPMEVCQNIAGTYGLEGLSGFHDNELKWYRTFRGPGDQKLKQDISGPNGRPNVNNMAYAGNRMRVANCKYIVFKGQNGGYSYAENRYALPRLSFTNSYKVATDEKDADRMLSAVLHDSRLTTIVEEKPSFESAEGSSIDTSLQVEWKHYANSYRAAKITTNSKGILRIAEVYYPGWEIKLNGKKVDTEDLIKRDIAWLGLEIDKGEYLLEMKPKSLYLGKAMKIALPLILLLFGIWGYYSFLYFSKREKIKK